MRWRGFLLSLRTSSIIIIENGRSRATAPLLTNQSYKTLPCELDRRSISDSIYFIAHRPPHPFEQGGSPPTRSAKSVVQRVCQPPAHIEPGRERARRSAQAKGNVFRL